jgi:hypothetical protein
MTPQQQAAMQQMAEAMQGGGGSEGPAKVREGTASFIDFLKSDTNETIDGVSRTPFVDGRDPRTMYVKNSAGADRELYDLMKSKKKKSQSEVLADLVGVLDQAPVREPSHISYFHEAIANPNWDMATKRAVVRKLAEYGFDPSRLHNNDYPVQRAIRLGDPVVLSILLQAGAKTALTDSRGYDAVACAIESGQPLLLPVLMRYSAPSSNTASGKSNVLLAVERFEADVLTKKEEAFNELYQTIGLLQQFGKVKITAGKHFFDPTTPEGKKLEAVMATLPAEARPVMDELRSRLEKIQPYTQEDFAAIARTSPNGVKFFTNLGGAQVKMTSTTSWLGLLKPNSFMNNLAGRTISKEVLKSMTRHTSDEDFKANQNTAVMAHAARYRNLWNPDLPSETPPHNTLVHHAVSIGSPAMLDYCIQERFNLHCVNDNGDYPLHLAAALADRDKLFEIITKMVGVIDPEKGAPHRKSLYPNGALADMRVLNAHNESMFDIVARTHPGMEIELMEHLGIPPSQAKSHLHGQRPGWEHFDAREFTSPGRAMTTTSSVAPTAPEPFDIRAIQGTVPEAQKQLLAIEDKSTPKLVPSSPADSEEERAERLKTAGSNILRMTTLLQIQEMQPEKRSELKSAIVQHLSELTMKEKITILLGALKRTSLATGVPTLQEKAYMDVAATTARDICTHLNQCTPGERAMVYNMFEDIERKSQDKSMSNILHLPAALSVLGNMSTDAFQELTAHLLLARGEKYGAAPDAPNSDVPATPPK